MKGNCVEGLKKRGDESVNREKEKGGEMMQRGRKSRMHNNERNVVKMMDKGEASEYGEQVRGEEKLQREGRKKRRMYNTDERKVKKKKKEKMKNE